MRLIQQSILITFAITSLSGCTTLGPDVCHIDVLWLHNEVSSDFIIDDEHVVMYPAAISGREDNFFSLTFYTYDEDGYYSSMFNLFVPATVGMHDLFSTPPPFMRWELDPSLVLLHADQFNRVYWPTSAVIVVDSLDLRNGGLVSGSLDVTMAAVTRLPALIESPDTLHLTATTFTAPVWDWEYSIERWQEIHQCLLEGGEGARCRAEGE